MTSSSRMTVDDVVGLEPAQDFHPEAAHDRTGSPSVSRKICYAAIASLGILSLIEAGARALTTDAAVQTRFEQIEQVLIHLGSDPGEIMFEADPQRFWRLKSALVLPQKADKRWSGRISNSLGFRNEEFSQEKPPGTFRIVCFGDSTTFGFGVDCEEAWPHLLQQSLNADDNDFPIQVVNAGVPGYTSHQGLQYMKQALPALQPDLVIVTFGNNDGWSWDDHTDREFAQRRQLTGEIPVLHASRAFQLTRLWYQSRISNIGRPGRQWAQQVWSYKTEADWRPRVPTDEFTENLNEIALLCRRAKTGLVLLQWPDRIQVGGDASPRQGYLDAIETVCTKHGLPRADLVDAFLARSAETWNMYQPNDNIHVDAAGNRLVGSVIHGVLARIISDRGTP